MANSIPENGLTVVLVATANGFMTVQVPQAGRKAIPTSLPFGI